MRDEREALSRLRTDADFQRTVARAQLVVQKVGVVAASGGDELQTLMGQYQQQIAGLT